MLAGEENPCLARDLGKHRRTHMAFGARTRDEHAELIEARTLPLDPLVDRPVRLLVAHPGQKLDPELLEVASTAGRLQPLPLMGGAEARDLLLRPVEGHGLAKAGVATGQSQFIGLAPRG